MDDPQRLFMADAKGATLPRAETVTLFNDLCCYTPSVLASPDIRWEPIDAYAATAHFRLTSLAYDVAVIR